VLQNAMVEVSRHAIDLSPMRSFTQGVLAGFLIAALVWMLPNLKHQEFLAVFTVTYLIGAAGAPHVIAGAVETFVVVIADGLGLGPALLEHILPTLAGNVVGGTGLFAALAYGQVWRELQDRSVKGAGHAEPSGKKDTPEPIRS
jgi:formate/nitrite transporter FocA (FNT family)